MATLTFTVNVSGGTSGGGSESGGGSTTTPTLISFTIGGTSYQAEEGMTWGEWADSKYDTNDNFIVRDTHIGIIAIHTNNLPGYSSATVVSGVDGNDIMPTMLRMTLSH